MVQNRTGWVRGAVRDVDRRAVVVELAVVGALAGAMQLYAMLLDDALDPYFLDSDVELWVLHGALYLAGLGVLAIAYGSVRGVSYPLSIPGRARSRVVGVAVAGAAVLASLSYLPFAVQSGPELAAALASTTPRTLLFGRTPFGLAVFVPSMALLYHGLVQGGFRRAFDRERAVVATTVVGGYLAIPSSALPVGIFRGPWLHAAGNRAAVGALCVLTLAIAVYWSEGVDDDRVRALAVVPLALALTLVGITLAGSVDRLVELVPMVSRMALVGVAAYAYDGTDSLLGPALVYAAFAATSVVFRDAAFDVLLLA